MDYAKMDEDMIASFKAFPAKTKGTGNEPMTPVVDAQALVVDEALKARAPQRPH